MSQEQLPQEQGINPDGATSAHGCSTSPHCGFIMEWSPRAMGTSCERAEV